MGSTRHGYRAANSRTSKAAAWAALASGAGFGIPCIFGIRRFADTGEVWQFLGFPTYGDGPFERVGMRTTVPLLLGYLTVCTAEIVLAVLVVRRSPSATRASTLLLPFELTYWVGFALPFGFVFGLARVLLLLPTHRSRHRPRASGGPDPEPSRPCDGPARMSDNATQEVIEILLVDQEPGHLEMVTALDVEPAAPKALDASAWLRNAGVFPRRCDPMRGMYSAEIPLPGETDQSISARMGSKNSSDRQRQPQSLRPSADVATDDRS